MTFDTSKYIFSVNESVTDQAGLRTFRGNVVMSASWEARSQDLLSYLEFSNIEKLILIRYANKGQSGISGTVRNRVREQCKKSGVQFQEVQVDSVGGDFAYYHSTVGTIVEGMMSTSGRWLIDISSLPRRIWTSLIFALDAGNLIRELVFFYSRPRYLFEESIFNKVVYSYTEGDWRLLEPPYSAMQFSSGLYRKNIISAGFEYDKLKSVMYQREAEANAVIYASPGFCDEYTKIAEETAARIKKVFSIPDEDILPIAIGDFCKVYRVAASILEANSNDVWDFSIICAGNKLHSLALCYVKTAFPEAHFYIRCPKGYKENATPGMGEFDLINVINKFAPI